MKTDKKLILYTATRPPMARFADCESLSLASGEVCEIIAECGNHWRKIFSIFAKLSFALVEHDCKTWQEYRDLVLLTEQGSELIVFEHHLVEAPADAIHFISGQKHFAEFDLNDFSPLDDDAKVLENGQILQTPYFDYRQLNNALIEQLVAYCQSL